MPLEQRHGKRMNAKPLYFLIFGLTVALSPASFAQSVKQPPPSAKSKPVPTTGKRRAVQVGSVHVPKGSTASLPRAGTAAATREVVNALNQYLATH